MRYSARLAAFASRVARYRWIATWSEPYVKIVHVAPETIVPVLYVKDAVRSLIGLKEASEAQLSRRVYNIQGLSPTAKEIADAVLRHIPQAKIDFKPDQVVINLFKDWPERLDDTRAREEWGWEPQYDLDKIVEDFIAEIKANRDIFA